MAHIAVQNGQNDNSNDKNNNNNNNLWMGRRKYLNSDAYVLKIENPYYTINLNQCKISMNRYNIA